MSAGHRESGWHTTALPAMAIILPRWRPLPSISHDPYFGKWLRYAKAAADTCSTRVCVQMFFFFVRSSRAARAPVRWVSKWRRRVWLSVCGGGILLQGCGVLFVCGLWSWWSTLFNSIRTEHTVHALYVDFSSFLFFSYTPPDMCEQTHWRKRTRIHTRMHAAGFMVPLSPGLLMERLPLINASFNDSPLKTGGRVIVCFSSSRAGKKWNDAEIYDVCSPVRQNY